MEECEKVLKLKKNWWYIYFSFPVYFRFIFFISKENQIFRHEWAAPLKTRNINGKDIRSQVSRTCLRDPERRNFGDLAGEVWRLCFAKYISRMHQVLGVLLLESKNFITPLVHLSKNLYATRYIYIYIREVQKIKK